MSVNILSQMPPKTPKSPFTIPLVPTTQVTPVFKPLVYSLFELTQGILAPILFCGYLRHLSPSLCSSHLFAC
jgi:hypothetical protein